MCEGHPHAGTLPNSSRYYMQLDIDGAPAGLAVWGYGVRPKDTPRHLFGDASNVDEYLELCRFFVYDWCPRNTPSKFLGVTHRILRKHAPTVKWLYTYAAGFQGMIGHIYKASGYDFIGQQPCTAFIYIPGVGLVHWVSIWHRYAIPVGSGNVSPKVWGQLHSLWPECVRWGGTNFRYIFWLCGKQERLRLLQSAKFQVLPYPTVTDLDIWTEDRAGQRKAVPVDFARSVPIVKLRTKRVGSVDSGTPDLPVRKGRCNSDPDA